MNNNQFSAPSAIGINRTEQPSPTTPTPPKPLSALSDPVKMYPLVDKKYQVFAAKGPLQEEINVTNAGSIGIRVFILCIPIFAIALSFIFFLQEMSFDFSKVSEYPNWVSQQIEQLVRANIVPMTEKQDQ